ncbi:ABC transporter permease [Oceanobacillus halophilus]|uniref:ABC transporter permease n=1 Tax=Oceanobacillus halophilus TaxID=930130 RepID=A0A494ZS33_9BACI|nr:ABC transporter permease [Oceanobacillus halophilus]RKQ28669.1 ABC transporter permease [Oceanobacillus halophilus]
MKSEAEVKTNYRVKKQKSIARIFSNHMLLTGLVIIVIMAIISVLAPFIAPYDPYAIDPLNRLKPPSVEHFFGTDDFGRDLFSRVIYGTRISFFIGAVVAILAGVIGLIVGLISAYYSILDHILMRIVDGIYAFPSILLALAIVAVRGPDVVNVLIALVIVYIPSIARVVRSAALVVKEQTFVEALNAQGASKWRVLVIHTIPNLLSPLIIQVTFVFAVAIITEAALSFLGAGIPAPSPSLGNILFDGKNVIYHSWWMTVFPGSFIILLVLGLNLAGDGLRDLLDPKIVNAKRKKSRLIKTGKKVGRHGQQ